MPAPPESPPRVHFPSPTPGFTWCGLPLDLSTRPSLGDLAGTDAAGVQWTTNMPDVRCPECDTDDEAPVPPAVPVTLTREEARERLATADYPPAWIDYAIAHPRADLTASSVESRAILRAYVTGLDAQKSREQLTEEQARAWGQREERTLATRAGRHESEANARQIAAALLRASRGETE